VPLPSGTEGPLNCGYQAGSVVVGGQGTADGLAVCGRCARSRGSCLGGVAGRGRRHGVHHRHVSRDHAGLHVHVMGPARRAPHPGAAAGPCTRTGWAGMGTDDGDRRGHTGAGLQQFISRHIQSSGKGAQVGGYDGLPVRVGFNVDPWLPSPRPTCHQSPGNQAWLGAPELLAETGGMR